MNNFSERTKGVNSSYVILSLNDRERLWFLNDPSPDQCAAQKKRADTKVRHYAPCPPLSVETRPRVVVELKYLFKYDKDL
jgi:hypothetical protein